MTITMNALLSSLPESLTLKITSRAKEMKKKGEDVIDFGVGEPDYDTPSFIKEAAIKAIREGETKYTAASGLPELKQAVIEKFRQDNNLDYDISQISINCGAKHSLFNIFLAILNSGDEVLLCSPYWLSYPEQIKIAGGAPVVIPTSLKKGFKVTPELIEHYRTPKTKAFVLNSPSNPAGIVYSREELEKLAQYLEQQDLWVICDEVYEYLVYENQNHYSLAAFSERLKTKSIVVNAVSKPFAMTGWRIGYCAGPQRIIKAINTIQSHSTSNPATPSQYAAISALVGSRREVNDMVKTYERRRQLMKNLLQDISGIEITPPQGAFYFFPDCSELIRKKKLQNSIELCEKLLEQFKVAAIPGTPFGAANCIRFSYALGDDAITEGMKRFRRFSEK